MINPAPFLIKDRGVEKGFIYRVIFPVDSVDTFSFSSLFTGKIAQVTAMNVASYTLKKNGVTTSFPLAVVKGDTITMESVVKIDSARLSTFIFRAPAFTAQDVTINAPTLVDDTRHHLFVMCFTDQTVSVIDTDTDTVVDTLTLPPGGYDFQTCAYRLVNDRIYVFGLNRVCWIDADPASGTFKNIYDLSGTINSSSSLSTGFAGPITNAVYDYVNDAMYIGVNNYALIGKWNFAASSVFLGISAATNPNFVYVPNDRLFHVDYISPALKADLPSGFLPAESGGSNISSKGCYCSANNSFYGGRNRVRKYDVDSFAQLISFNVGAGNSNYAQSVGNIVYCPDYDIVVSLTYEYLGGTVAIIDTVTNTLYGTFVRTNKEANDLTARSMVYGAKAKKLYFMGNGTASPIYRVHKFDPQLWVAGGKTTPADMIDGYITCGNILNNNATGTRYANNGMCFNHLIPN